PFFVRSVQMFDVITKLTHFLYLITILATWAQAASSQQRGADKPVMGLVELYGTSAVILYGEDDKYSATGLFAALQPAVKGLKRVPAKGLKPPKDDLVIYLGSFKSNPLAQQVFKSLNYSIKWEAMTDGSFFLKTFRKSGRTTVFACGKDRFGTL